MGNDTEILRRWQLLSPHSNRRQRSMWAAVEAEVIGYRGCTLLSRLTDIAAQTIAARRIKLRLTSSASAGSLVHHQKVRGQGRKLVEVKDPNVVPALERMLSDEVAGDPMGQQKWVRSSIRNLSKQLKDQGHQVGHGAVTRRVGQLRALGGTRGSPLSLYKRKSPSKSRGGPLRASCGLMQCSKGHLDSITLSARPSNEGGTARPSALAVLRLTISSEFVATCTHLGLPYESHRLRAPDGKVSTSEVQ